MSERRRNFIRALALAPVMAEPERPRPETPIASSSRAVDAKPSRSSSSAPVSNRKRYISMLVKPEKVVVEDGSDPEPAASEKPSHVSDCVSFTLDNLKAFRDTADGIALGKTAAEARPPRRRRPNYNSSKRKLFSKMPERAKFLAMVGTVSWLRGSSPKSPLGFCIASALPIRGLVHMVQACEAWISWQVDHADAIEAIASNRSM